MHLTKIVVDFGLIVLDEPLSVLDLNVEEKIMTQILDKNNKNTVFILLDRRSEKTVRDNKTGSSFCQLIHRSLNNDLCSRVYNCQ